MKKYIFLATAVVALAACSSNEEFEQTGSYEINLSSALLVQTRAAQGIQSEAFDSGEDVDVFINENTTGTASTTYKQPLTYRTGKGGALTTTTTQYFPQNNNGVNIIAVYPSGLTTNVKEEALNFSVQSNQSDSASYKASDLMFGKPSNDNPVARTASNITLEFKHCLSKINVNIKAGAGVYEDDLQGATVTIYTETNDATFNVQTGEVTTVVSQGQAASPFVSLGALTVTEDEGPIGMSGIIIPQDIPAGSQFITIRTIGQTPTTYSYSIPAGDAKQFESGYAYTYNITVTKSGLTVNSSSISNWEDGGSVDGDALPN